MCSIVIGRRSIALFPASTFLPIFGKQADPSTVARQIKRHSEVRPDHAAVVFPDSTPLSYRELQRLIDEVHVVLRTAGLGRSARIATALPNGPHAALALIAVACSSVPVPLNPEQTLNEIERSFAVLRPNAILLLKGTDYAARRAAEREGIAIIEAIPAKEGTLALEVIGPRARTIAPADEPDPNAPAFILQTSGTSSEPKWIPFSHRSMLAAATRHKAWYGLTPSDRCLSLSPLYYSHGIKVTLFTPLLTGGTVAFPKNPSKINFAEWFGTLKPTWYSAGPTLHRLIFDHARSRADAKTGHSLRFITGGGAPLPLNVLEGLQHTLGVPVVEHYGSSEAALIASNEPPPGRSKAGTLGIPWPNTLMIVDENGRQLPPTAQGEIWVRGPTVMSGYLDRPELNSESFVDGWLKTGDIGSLDEEGFLTLHGRRRDLINRGGEKIWPTEIDDALLRHPAVGEAAAFAVAHSRLGQNIAAAVVLRPGMKVTPLELRTYLREMLTPFKVPSRIIFVDQLPKGTTGKVLRRRLSDSMGPTESPSPTALNTQNGNLAFQLTEVWERLLGFSPVGIDDNFFEIGGDSLLAQEMLQEIVLLTGRSVPSSILFEASTIRQLTQRLSDGDSLETKPLIRINSNGRQPPLIFFHGDPNGGHYVAKLASLLGSNQPIFVVNPHGIDNDAVPHSLEAMAADRLPSIMHAQPEGPYRLGGYCLGGLVAFEAARLLVSAGKKVEVVVIIDAPTTNVRQSVQTILSILNRLPTTELAIAKTWYYLVKVERFAKFSPSQWCAKAIAKAPTLFVAGRDKAHRAPKAGWSGVTLQSNHPSPVPRPFSRQLFGYYFWRYAIALSRYLPKPLAVQVIFFSSRYDGGALARICPNFEMIRLSSDHYQMLNDPTDLAAHLAACLQTKII